MSSSPAASEGGISQLLHTEREMAPPEFLASRARLRDYDSEHLHSVQDPDGFWADVAGELEWFRPWDQVFEWTYPTFRWFLGGRCNITHNCLDRNVLQGRRNKVVVLRRERPLLSLTAPRELDFDELVRGQPPHCPPEVMESEDPHPGPDCHPERNRLCG